MWYLSVLLQLLQVNFTLSPFDFLNSTLSEYHVLNEISVLQLEQFVNSFILIDCVFVRQKCPVTFDGMVSCGITKRFPISLHQLFLRATNLRKPLKPACTIPCVVHWAFFTHLPICVFLIVVSKNLIIISIAFLNCIFSPVFLVYTTINPETLLLIGSSDT